VSAAPAAITDEDLPAFFRASDAAAKEAQRRFLFWTALMLALSLVAAVFGTFAIGGGDFDWAGLVTLLGLACATFAAFWLVRTNPNRRWYDSRAAAESTKSLAWQYTVCGGDFGRGRDDSEVRADLVDRLKAIRRQLEGATPLPLPHGDEITQRMNDIRASDLEARRSVYAKDRIRDQHRFYSDNAQKNEKWRKRWWSGSIVMQAFGLIGALLKMLGKLDIELAGIAITAAVAITAWSRTRAHEELAEAYAVTAHEVNEIGATINDVIGEEQWATYVANAEQAFSREHTLWRARRRQLTAE